MAAGAEPPFGHLYDMRTFVDRKLSEQATLYMSAGNHKELLGVAWPDFAQLVQPTVCDIAKVRAKPRTMAEA